MRASDIKETAFIFYIVLLVNPGQIYSKMARLNFFRYILHAFGIKSNETRSATQRKAMLKENNTKRRSTAILLAILLNEFY